MATQVITEDLTLDATWGATSQNCYVLVSEADSIIPLNHLDIQDWTNADDETKARALLVATNQIEGQRWHGTRFYWNQPLAFPRSSPGEEHPVGIFGTADDPGGQAFANLVEVDMYLKDQKLRVRKATCAQALYNLQMQSGNSRPNKHRDLQRLGVRNFSFSGAGVSESYSYERMQVLCQEAAENMYYYKSTGARICRGDTTSYEYD